MEQITLEQIIPLVTAVVTYILGLLPKKFDWYESKYIPIQNGVIGIISAMIYYIVTPECNFGVVLLTILSSFAAGGIYDTKKVKE